MESKMVFFLVFIVLGLLFSIMLLYFVTFMKSSRKVLRARMFLHADPIIKSFYQFFMGVAFAYILFLIYFLDQTHSEPFILGELILGLSLIGLAYLITPLFSVGRDK